MDGTQPVRLRGFLVALVLVAAALWLCAVPVAAKGIGLGIGKSAALGQYLTGPNGHALYTLSSDTATASVCTTGCLGFWPPLTLSAGQTVTAPARVSGRFASFVRADTKATQVSYNGHPLYYFRNDTAAGQTTGEGLKALGGVWHVAKATVGAAGAHPPVTATASATDQAMPSRVVLLALMAVAASTFGLRLIRPVARGVRRR
jgi:predicted lipoprotein with Yx(FWY)xxD motif